MKINHLGGALARPPAVANAVGHRDAGYLLRVLSPVEPATAHIVEAAHGRLMDAVASRTLGRSPNFLFGAARTPERLAEGYAPDARDRLAKIAAAHDPAGVFQR
ncbi:hypothetical protein [Pseudonocardia nigra]|uniref:hypothetical protein n=1 Tax=Pseudonocardia nigra TaxID=1921578 RepID=UPI001FE30117|nr:hypothetical protein [Pseudonocardia nigra]